MDILQVREGRVVDGQGQPFQLRGTCVGGWMNMENFINGYPGAEQSLRQTFVDVLGQSNATFFFDRLLDYFLAENDLAFMKELGATVVRLPLNYRHFERDAEPFTYLTAGFERLDKVLSWCAKYGLYAILDLHSVQGWQNTDWHCDNANRHSLLWTHRQFQDRFVALWEEFARRYVGNEVVAGYNVLNEPTSNVPQGRLTDEYTSDWPTMNGLYERVTRAIRAIDPDHIIFLEGDLFSSRFSGLAEPFAPNLVYSSHNYTPAGFGPGAYPGQFNGQDWDQTFQAKVFEDSEGWQFAQRYNVPLWVGEFGSTYNGPTSEIPDRLRALDDQITVFEQYGVHWTTWTYKDVGVMGWVTLDPASDYMRLIEPTLTAKYALDTDFWQGWLGPTPAKQLIGELAKLIETTIADPDIAPGATRRYLSQAAFDNYTGSLMQPSFAKRFKGMSEARLDEVLQSFALKNCRPHQGLLDVLKKQLAGQAAKL